jgi:ABC-type dipeptide/oligopeptide/nickel transport system permease component
VLKYTLYRVLQLVPVWLLLSVFVFAIVHALPGDAIDALVPPDAASNPETRAALEKDLGLDKPLYVQYARWLGRIVLHGDFGKSITTRRTISVEVFKRLPATIYLAVTSVIVSLLIAIPLGTIAAVKRRTLVDYTATATALTGFRSRNSGLPFCVCCSSPSTWAGCRPQSITARSTIWG